MVVTHVSWARHHAGHTELFNQQVAWLVARCSKSTVSHLMRVSWRNVGAILEREYQALDAGRDRLAGVRWIGTNKVSYKNGHRCLSVVVDHDTGRLLTAVTPRH